MEPNHADTGLDCAGPTAGDSDALRPRRSIGGDAAVKAARKLVRYSAHFNKAESVLPLGR